VGKAPEGRVPTRMFRQSNKRVGTALRAFAHPTFGYYFGQEASSESKMAISSLPSFESGSTSSMLPISFT
jgi:hypothetical protein